MGRLRIAVVTPELPSREYPHRGRSVYQTLRRLCDHAELQAFCPLPRYPAFLHPRFDYRETDLSYSLPGLSTRYLEYPAIPVITRPVNGFRCARSLEPHIRHFHADVILNFVLYPAGFAALSVGRRLGIPVVLGSIGSDLNAIPDPLSHWLTRRALHGASRIITKSKELRARAVGMGASPNITHVIENGCDEDIFFMRNRDAARHELNISRTAELIVFVGRMHRRKGIGELLDAVTALFPTRPNLYLVYVGDGPELKAIEEKVNARGLMHQVKFAGARSSGDVAQWLAAANLLALPSYSEGCPNAVIEALSCGRAVVATAVGGIPDLVNSDCGILVPVGQVEALKDALDAALDTMWNEAAIAKVCCRSWEKVAQETLAICEGLLGNGQA